MAAHQLLHLYGSTVVVQILKLQAILLRQLDRCDVVRSGMSGSCNLNSVLLGIGNELIPGLVRGVRGHYQDLGIEANHAQGLEAVQGKGYVL